MFAAPSWFSPRGRGRVSRILPPTLPLTRPMSRVRGEFTGECGGTLTGSNVSPVAGPARVRSGPGAGSAGTRQRLRLFAQRAAGRGFLANSPSGPGSARSRPGAPPLWHHTPRWTRGKWAIHPAARSRLLRGVASRDQPPERLRYAPPPAAGRGLSSRGWSRLAPAAHVGAQFPAFWGRVIALF